MSQVLLVQPRTEDGQGGGVLHLRLPSHCPILVPGGLQIYSSSTLLCFEELHSKCCVKEGFQDKGTMKNTICLDLATFLRAVQGCYDIVLFIKQCLINTENEECIVFQLN